LEPGTYDYRFPLTNKGDFMADDRANPGEPVSSQMLCQRYYAKYFAMQHGISTQEAMRLIREHGDNWEELDRASQMLKQR
jgi:hypothetical protein